MIVLSMISMYTSSYFKSLLPKHLAIIIKERRAALKLTQRELGMRCHFSEYIIKKMEKGKHDFKVTELEKLAFGLESTVKNFFYFI